MKNYLHILTLTAFLLGVIAPACGFAWGGTLNVIELCTDKGIEFRIIANNKQKDKNPVPMVADECQFCFTNTTLTNFLPENVSIKIKYNNTEKQQYSLYEVVLLSHSTRSKKSRAPPILT